MVHDKPHIHHKMSGSGSGSQDGPLSSSPAVPLGPSSSGPGVTGDGRSARQKRSSLAETLASRLAWLNRTLILLFVAAIATGLYPFQPWAPLWYLRISQLLVDYCPILILALGLALLASFYEPQTKRVQRHRFLARRMASLILVVYAVLVPLQLFSFGWFWLDSGAQLREAIRSSETRLASLRSRVTAAASEADFRFALANGEPQAGVLPSSIPLSQQKRDLLTAIDRDRVQLPSTLTQQRKQQLSNLVVSTLRGLIAATVMAAGMVGVKRFS
jgi:hypothetical protein